MTLFCFLSVSFWKEASKCQRLCSASLHLLGSAPSSLSWPDLKGIREGGSMNDRGLQLEAEYPDKLMCRNKYSQLVALLKMFGDLSDLYCS